MWKGKLRLEWGRTSTCGILLIGMLGVGMVASALAIPSGHPERGRVVYDQYCISCHGQTGRGDGTAALTLSPRPASLISASTSAKSDNELLRIIAEGKPHTAMRPWKGTLTEEEQRDVLAYIRSLVRFVPSLPVEPSSSTR
ncbi:hypothetical protein YTPLAS18_37750 [Nitrospira sp.]|nr:hypothetical protein YTPLAS18_37750 [Nitrospira sp.]